MSDLIAELRRSAEGDDHRLADLLGTLRATEPPGGTGPRANRELAAFLAAAATDGLAACPPTAPPASVPVPDLVVELGHVPAPRARSRPGWLRALVPATLWAKAVMAATVAVAAMAVAGGAPSDDVVVRPASDHPAASGHAEVSGDLTVHPGAVGGPGGARAVTTDGATGSDTRAPSVRLHAPHGPADTLRPTDGSNSGTTPADGRDGNDAREHGTADHGPTADQSDDAADDVDDAADDAADDAPSSDDSTGDDATSEDDATTGGSSSEPDGDTAGSDQTDPAGDATSTSETGTSGDWG